MVAAEVRLLRTAGINVETIFEDNDSIGDSVVSKAKAAGRLFRSGRSDEALVHAVRDLGANLLHVHNLIPLLSASIIVKAKEVGIPVVASIHNYRLQCPGGTLFRDGHICTECHGLRVAWPAVRHACYRGSHAQSLAVALSQAHHAETWRLVDRFVAVSSFVADFLESMGIPRARIDVKPNALPDPASPRTGAGAGVLYAGRLDREKGIELLLEAWTHLDSDSRYPLTIVGDGPAAGSIKAAAGKRPDIRYLGLVPATAVGELMDRSSATCIPSIWYEALPMTFVESIAHGRPVVATNLGALGRLVNESIGWSVKPTPESLAVALAAARYGDLERSRNARALYEREYTEDASLSMLLSIYSQALGLKETASR